MKQLLDSCGTDQKTKCTLLNLVSAILAGYCSRVCQKYYDDYVQEIERRAPIVAVKYADYSYHVLEKVMRSVAKNTSVDNRRVEDYACSNPALALKAKYYPTLPRWTSDRSITDCAYIKVSKNSGRLLPQYRDTTLLVNCRFFRLLKSVNCSEGIAGSV